MTTVEVIPCSTTGRVKCPRCFRWTYSINHDCLCNRCVAVILEDHPSSPHASAILKNLEERGLSPEDNPYLSK